MMEQSFNKGIIYESSIPLKDSFQMITAESTFNSTVYSSPKKRIVGQGSIISCMGHFVVKKKTCKQHDQLFSYTDHASLAGKFCVDKLEP
jgi:hypothetical protein